MRRVLIGSHPKGFSEPFHPDTHSGRVLRKIIGNNLESYLFFDIWSSEEDQKANFFSPAQKEILESYIKSNYEIFALGRAVEEFMITNGYPHKFLPHPASRRKNDRDKLTEALTNPKLTSRFNSRAED